MEERSQQPPTGHEDGAPFQEPGLIRHLHAWVLIGLVGFGAMINLWAFHDYVFEDAYITYCYAQNLAAGKGFVFNEGERVLGTSTPLYTLLLAALAACGAPIPAASGVVFAVSLGLAGWLGAHLLRRFGSPNLGLVFALASVWGVGRWMLIWGMETPLYLAVLLGALLAALRRRDLATGVLLGLGFLIRYDGALFALCLLCLLAIRHRRLPIKAGCAAAAIALPWLAFSQLYFGSVFPNTLGAKMATTSILQYMSESLGYQIKGLFSPLHGDMGIRGFSSLLAAGLAAALVIPVLVAWRRLARREPLLWQLALFPVLLLLGYAVIGPPTGHFWHLLPGMYMVVLLALLAWGQLMNRFRLEPAASVVSLILALLLGAALPLGAAARARLLTDNEFYRGRVAAYSQIAQWVLDKELGDLSVMMREPGFFRFLSGCYMVDAAGLVTKGIKFHGPKDEVTDQNQIVQVHQPDLIVSSPLGSRDLDLRGYLPLFHAVPLRTLFISRAAFGQRFPALATTWLAPETGGGAPGHPVRCDFRPAQMKGWITGGRLWAARITATGARSELDLSGLLPEEVQPPFLSSDGKISRWGTATSPEFMIDFDELSFLLVASAKNTTQARLLVDGQAVLVAAGTGEHPPRAQRVRWPVQTWRGRTAVIQFCDLDLSGEFLIADRLRSWRYRALGPNDDFESGDYSEHWQTGFGDRPARLDDLAKRHGLHLLVGRHAALSWGMDGVHEMKSTPFVLNHCRLALLVFDFGGAKTRVELRVGDQPARVWTGARTRRLQPLVWNLDDLVGQTVVLAVVDADPRPHEWLGIDALVLYGRKE